MIWTNLVILLIMIYVILSILAFFVVNSNIFPNRRFAKYELDFDNLEMRKLDDEGIVYWYVKNGESKKDAIILHGFTRNSKKMESRAKIYFELGFNIYLVDNAGHGRSKSILFPSGVQYSWIVKKIIEREGLVKPVLHGASMGAIASAYVAQKNPDVPKLIVCEALPNNFDNLYKDMLDFMKIPFLLFFWLDWLSRLIVWNLMFRGKDIEYELELIQCPIFIIHGEHDKMFKYMDHYNKNVELFNDRDNFSHWLVPGSRHSKMNFHPDYDNKLKDFILKYS